MININHEMNAELKAKCTVLEDYTVFVEKVRSYSKSMSLPEAVDRAVDECAGEGALGRFLDKHRKEVRNMVLTEFDEEKYLKMMREEEWADGHTVGLKEGHATGLKEGHATGLKEGHVTGLKEGHATGLKEGHATGLKEGYATGLMAGRRENLLSMLEELGEIPDDVMVRIEELDAEGIKYWNKLASRVGSMEEFLLHIKR